MLDAAPMMEQIGIAEPVSGSIEASLKELEDTISSLEAIFTARMDSADSTNAELVTAIDGLEGVISLMYNKLENMYNNKKEL